MNRLLAAVALLLAANGIAATALPLGWSRDGLPASAIALLGAAQYAGMLLGAPTLRRLGVAGSGLVLAAAIPAAAAHLPLAGLLPLRLAAGAGLAALTIAVESRLNALAPPAGRARVLSVYMVVFYLAQAAGAAAAGLVRPEIAAALVLAAALTLGGADGAQARGRYRDLLAATPLGYGGGLAAGVLLGLFYGLGPVHARTGLSDPALVGPFMAAAMLGGVAALLPLGLAADRGGRRRWLGLALAAAVLAGLGLLGAKGDGAMLVAAALFGAAAFTVYPLASAVTNQAMPPARLPAANGAFVQVSAVGGCLGPLAAALVLP